MKNETYLSAVNYAIENLSDAPASILEKLTALSASLSKKNSAERKPTPKQRENAGFKADIVAWMKPDTLYCVADVCKGVPSFEGVEGMTHNRVTALLSQLVKEQVILREEVKGKAFFKLA